MGVNPEEGAALVLARRCMQGKGDQRWRGRALSPSKRRLRQSAVFPRLPQNHRLPFTIHWQRLRGRAPLPNPIIHHKIFKCAQFWLSQHT